MKTENDKLSGYFFTDKSVREAESLSDISKLVFGDIAYFYFLGEGKCRATNTFFAKKYSKSEGTISRAISELTKYGYINRYLDEYKNRTIFINRSAFAKVKLDPSTKKPGISISDTDSNFLEIDQPHIPGSDNKDYDNLKSYFENE